MIDDIVGISDLPQGLAFVTLLPARLLAGSFAQARHPRRLLQPIARRRLAAVRTVQSEPALKFGDPRLQSRIFGRCAAISAISSSLDGSLGDSRIIRFLNRKPPPPSRKIYRQFKT